MIQSRRQVGTVQGSALRNPVWGEASSATVGYPTWCFISSESVLTFNHTLPFNQRSLDINSTFNYVLIYCGGH